MLRHEKRDYVRIHFESQARVEFLTEVYDKCQVKNISSGGMFVNGNFPPILDDQCYVNLTQTSKRICLTLRALAKIVRQDDEGIALRFTSMSFESLLSLEMILLYQEREETSDTEITLPKELPFEIREGKHSASDK